MYLSQWHLDLGYGKQSQALEVLQMWGKEKMASSEFRRARQTRLLVGHLGVSPSHVTDEYVFESLADFEAALAGMTQPQFRAHSDALAPSWFRAPSIGSSIELFRSDARRSARASDRLTYARLTP